MESTKKPETRHTDGDPSPIQLDLQTVQKGLDKICLDCPPQGDGDLSYELVYISFL